MKSFELKGIWLSSIEHLEKLNSIRNKSVSSVVWWKRLFGIKEIDSEFPQIIIFGMPTPIVYYSIGRVEINSDVLYYTALTPVPKTFTEYKNIQNKLKLEIQLTEIEFVSMYKNPNPFMEQFNYPWVRIRMRDGKEHLIASIKETGEI
ncbi:MAG TPA: hypothetical protein PKI86_08765 [Chitinophagales bacterium]|nr:hypothetical protein [Chitinophagales bacterium]